MNTQEKNTQETLSLSIGEFFKEREGKLSKGRLVPYAAHLCLIYTYAGAPSTTDFINKQIGTNLSTSPIINIVEGVIEGKIRIRNEEVIQAAQQAPEMMKFIERFLPQMTGEFFEGKILAQMTPRRRKQSFPSVQGNEESHSLKCDPHPPGGIEATPHAPTV
jgi:hypothetical protein